MNGVLITRQYVVTIQVYSFPVQHATYTEVAEYNGRLVWWGGHEVRMGYIINAHTILVGTQESKISVWDIYEEKARLTFYVEREISANFCLHAGNINFKTQNEECIINFRITCWIVPVCLSIQHVQQKCTEYNKKNIKRRNSEPWIGCLRFQPIFQNKLVM
jgi:hypothetical protein